jgi:hypothetical protein
MVAGHPPGALVHEPDAGLVVAPGDGGTAMAGERHGVAEAHALAPGGGDEAGAQAVAPELPRVVAGQGLDICRSAWLRRTALYWPTIALPRKVFAGEALGALARPGVGSCVWLWPQAGPGRAPAGGMRREHECRS